MRHDFLLTEGRQGRSRTKRGEETHQRRGQNGISGSERRQEMAFPRLFPPGFTLHCGLLLRSHEPRTCTEETRVREQGGRREGERMKMKEEKRARENWLKGATRGSEMREARRARPVKMQGDKELETMKISPSFVGAAVAVAGQGPAVRVNGRGVATLLCSVHAPGISQLADRPHVPCGEAIPENGRAVWVWGR
jgi:hypothetical protein